MENGMNVGRIEQLVTAKDEGETRGFYTITEDYDEWKNLDKTDLLVLVRELNYEAKSRMTHEEYTEYIKDVVGNLKEYLCY